MKGITIEMKLFKTSDGSRNFHWMVPLMFFVFFTTPLLSKANEDPDEISVFISIQKTGIYIPALLQDEALYLPVSEVFNFLKINNQSSLDSISGFIIDPKNSFLIEYVPQRISIFGSSFTLTSKEIIRTNTNLYLRSDVFGKVFGLECTFQFRNLAVVINTKLDLPLLRELRQQTLHNNLKKLQGEIKPDTLIKRQYPFLRLGVADWSILNVKELGGSSTTRINMEMGALLAGGEAKVTLNYDNNIPIKLQQQQYQWRFVNNNLKTFKQLTLGTIPSQATASIFAPVNGVQLTNTPTNRRKSFGSYVISDHTQPDWMVELYVNNVLIDYVKADPSGFFSFNVPLLYGNSNVKLKFLGPTGEESSIEKEMNIPINYLPARNFEYILNAGIVKDSLHSRYSKIVLHYGLSSHMTVGGGIEYLSSVKTGTSMPFLYTTLKLSTNAFFSSELTEGVRWKNMITWQFPSRLHLEVNYLKYTKGQKAITTSNLEERNVTLSMPFQKQDLFFLSKLSVNQVVQPTISYDSLIKTSYNAVSKLKQSTAELTLSAIARRISVNLTTTGFFHDKSSSSIYSNLSLAYRLPQNLVFRSQLQYNYSQSKLNTFKIEAEKQLYNQGFVNLSLVRDLSTNNSTISFGMRYNFSFLKTAFSAVRSNKTTTLVQSAGGSLLVDGSSGSVMHSNRSYNGRGSLSIAAFLDINCNGKRDENEPSLHGLKFRIRGGHVIANSEEDIIRVVDLEPYTNYLIELDENSFGNISWLIKNKTISVVVEPNAFKLVEVPVAVVGEASGMVFFKTSKEQRGLSRINVNFYDSTGTRIAQTMTEGDGYFSYLGLTPGSYTGRIDTTQLRLLNLSSSPSSLNFTIASSKDGVVANGFEFILKSTNKEPDVNQPVEQLANETKRILITEEKKVQLQNNNIAIQAPSKPYYISNSPLSVEQKQIIKAEVRRQNQASKATQDSNRYNDRVMINEKEQTLKGVKDSRVQASQMQRHIRSSSPNKTSLLPQRKRVAPNNEAVSINKKVLLLQKQIKFQADKSYKKEQELQQKLKKLIAENQRLIEEQKQLLREIKLLKMKLKQAISNESGTSKVKNKRNPQYK
jgi:hypothetical protein